MSPAADPRRLRGAPLEVQREFLIRAVRADSVAETVLTRACAAGLPDWRLVSGAIYQNVWNALTGRPPGYGVKDYDLAYFDASDLSYEAEDRVIQAMVDAFSDIAAEIEVRNQARVHLWFGPKFGVDWPALASTDDGIRRYAADAHKLGLRLEPDGSYDLFAPAGLDAVFDLRVEPSAESRLADPEGFAAKAQRQKQLWPELKASL
jgi:hypothetical protein